MSVYTRVNREELDAFLLEYDIGKASRLDGINEGIENTNYYLITDAGEYVLTLFERHRFEELPYYLDLMAFFADRGIPCARPVRDTAGSYLRRLNGRPATIVHRLEGVSVRTPSYEQCVAVGRALARMHREAAGFSLTREPSRGPAWWREAADRVLPLLPKDEQSLLEDELAEQENNRFLDAPSGVIHADLFRDNALFVGDRLTGIIDFYYACNWPFVFDLAVAVNDWCNTGDRDRDTRHTKALLRAYQDLRRVSEREIEVWPMVLRAAALRFWLSRLADKHFPRRGELTHVKDPGVFRDVLRRNIAESERNRASWLPSRAA